MEPDALAAEMLQQWGCSSAGRAPALQAGGQEFDPPHLHQRFLKGKQRAEGETKVTGSQTSVCETN